MARSGGDEAGMGQELTLMNDATLDVSSPLAAHIRLLHNGRVVAEHRGRRLRYRTSQPGAYRVEAYRRHLFRERGWVYTNPIYLRRL
ncbi:MAG: hypothetical protein D6791_12115 [Chloroflexi bacterium]|nr:MAG: hypothetical protein D6791_12115 [Chloroflexota bacterium]